MVGGVAAHLLDWGPRAEWAFAPMSDRTEITRLLNDASSGGAEAVNRLYPIVYDELRRLAQHHLDAERRGHTLQATALVNEAYLKLVDQTRVDWKNRAHFFAVAAQAIRRILVDYARQRARDKRGGDWQRVALDDVMNLPASGPASGLVALNDAIERMGATDPDKLRIVELRFFAGLTHDEIAEVMNVSTRTVERHWQYARAWLYRELSNG